MAWLELTVSAVLTITITVSGWMFSRIVNRIDKIEQRMSEMSSSAAERDSQQDARINALEKQTLTKDDLREVMDAALDKATAPITQELQAIKINSDKTRERLIKLEATYEANQQ